MHRSHLALFEGVRVAWLAGACALALGASCAPSSTGGSPSVITPTSPVSDPGVDPAPAALSIQREAWKFEDRDGLLLTTPGYRIYTTLGESSLVAKRMPRFMETALTHYTSAITPLPLPTSRLETYVMANRPEWTRITQRVMGNEAEVYLRIQRGGFSSDGRAVLYDIGPRDTLAIAAHEGWHQYTQRAFRQPLPIWLEEGLACYMEGFRWESRDLVNAKFLPWSNEERYDTLRRLDRYSRIRPLDELLNTSPQELMERGQDAALGYYAQVWALVHFLNEGNDGAYAQGLQRMLTDAQAGRMSTTLTQALGGRASSSAMSRRRGDMLLRAYLGKDAAALNPDYNAFITHIVRIGAKQQIVQGISPVEPRSP